jgi:hypothetical protein
MYIWTCKFFCINIDIYLHPYTYMIYTGYFHPDLPAITAAMATVNSLYSYTWDIMMVHIYIYMFTYIHTYFIYTKLMIIFICMYIFLFIYLFIYMCIFLFIYLYITIMYDLLYTVDFFSVYTCIFHICKFKYIYTLIYRIGD